MIECLLVTCSAVICFMIFQSFDPMTVPNLIVTPLMFFILWVLYFLYLVIKERQIQNLPQILLQLPRELFVFCRQFFKKRK
jgi:amino acid permease